MCIKKERKSYIYVVYLHENVHMLYIVGNEGSTLESLQFNWATIEAATDRFSNKNRIGKGGFGEVYMVTRL